MRNVYRVLAYLIVLGVFIQAAAIAYGWFAVINELDSGAVITSDYEGNAGHALHGTVGMFVLPVLALLLLIVSFFSKVRRGVMFAAIVFGLVALQVTLAFLAFGLPAIGALHGMNALAIVALAAQAGRLSARGAAPLVETAAPASAARTAV